MNHNISTPIPLPLNMVLRKWSHITKTSLALLSKSVQPNPCYQLGISTYQLMLLLGCKDLVDLFLKESWYSEPILSKYSSVGIQMPYAQDTF